MEHGKLYKPFDKETDFIDFVNDNDFAKDLFLNENMEDMLYHIKTFGFYDKEDLVGVGFVGKNENFDHLYFVNVAFLKKARGKLAIALCREWLKEYAQYYQILVSLVKKKNKEAFFFNKILGFKRFSENEDSYLMRYN